MSHHLRRQAAAPAAVSDDAFARTALRAPIGVSDERVLGLDFLRGLFIFMAMIQHYTGYLNYWYQDFFRREEPFWGEVYASHLPMVGQLNPMDGLTATLSAWLVPWVSQIYIALAAFNLSRDTQAGMRAKLASRLVLFTSVYLIFVAEGLVIGPDFGEAISFYPVMLWMVLLALFATVYACTGLIGMAVLGAVALVLAYFGDANPFGGFETWMRAHVHPGYEFDARVDLFGASGVLGFAYGWCWHHKPALRSRLNYGVLAGSAVLIALYVLCGPTMHMDSSDIYATEHEMMTNFMGLIGIIGIEFAVVSIVLSLHQRGCSLSFKPVNWVGFYSLTVFFFHKMFFIFAWGPLLLFISAKLGTTLPNNFAVVCALAVATIGCVWVIKRARVAELLMGANQDARWRRVY